MNQIPDVSTLSADDYPNIEAVQVDSAYWDEQQHANPHSHFQGPGTGCLDR